MASKETKTDKTREEIGEIVSRSERFIEDNKKTIIGVIVAAIVIVGLFFAYKYVIKNPREKRANIAIFHAQNAFARDSFSLALNGNAKFQGFLDIQKKYKGTEASNLSKLYAGICYNRIGKYQESIDMLKSFKGKDIMVSPSAIGLIGDNYVFLNQYDKAVTYFEKAASSAQNDIISPIYLMKAGRAYEELKKYDKALRCYKTIKEKYYRSMEAQTIDKYILRAESLNK